MIRFRQQVEIIDLLLAEVHLAQVPGHALVEHGLAAAVAVADFQGALGEADSARAHADRVVVIQHHGGHTLQGQVHGRREAGGAAAHDDHRVVHRLCRILVRAADVGVFGVRVAAWHLLCVAIIVANENNIVGMWVIIKKNEGISLNASRDARSQ